MKLLSLYANVYNDDSEWQNREGEDLRQLSEDCVEGRVNMKAKFSEQMCFQEQMFWIWANAMFRLSEEEEANL